MASLVGAHGTHAFDSTRVRTYGRLAHDLNLADITEAINVGPAAEFETVGAGAHHADAVAVFIAEEGDRPHGLGFLLRRLNRVHFFVSYHVGIHQRQDFGHLLRRHSGAVREVEAQSVRSHERALLTNVVTQDGAQSRVQQVRRRVIATRRLTSLGVDGRHRDLTR